FKDAPFDVTESKLSNTFFSTWDSIKNNVILNWVDVEDSKGQYGCALFSDHTTSYTHGENFPLGLTLLYSGVGLWGMDYKITGATEVDYALIPHKGRWEQSGIWSEASRWKEPVVASLVSATFTKDNLSKSLMQIDNPHIEISSIRVDGKDLLVRFFNASLYPGTPKISFGFKVDKAEIVELNGMTARKLNIEKDPGKNPYINVDIPRFGIRTIRISRPD
ncbi:MAG: glycosyl hydrolase, partial [Bacteroidota bacterium]|nr:glycosyl hydrolase [Bacteroidota bacterium]